MFNLFFLTQRIYVQNNLLLNKFLFIYLFIFMCIKTWKTEQYTCTQNMP